VIQRRLSALALFLILATALIPAAMAQVDVATATLKGTVYDPNLGAIPGATVLITNTERGFSKTVATGEDGAYQVPLLLPGMYRIEVRAEGFETVIAAAVELSIGQAVVFDAHLKLGSVQSEVNVTEEAPLIEGEKTQQANTLAKLAIDNLPNVTRNFTDSVFTLPGVSSSDAPRSQFPGYTGFVTSGFSIGGSNGRTNLVTIDGGENDYGSGQLRTPNISVESVEEFQVNRSAFNAEFGFTAGTAVNVVTKNGTNAFHGSAYGYFRDQYTEARNYFDTFSQTPFDQSFFPGVTLGGPIKKNKLFFFTSYEFRKIDTAQFRNYLNTPEALGINGSPDQLNYVRQLAASGNPTLMGLAGFFQQALVPMSINPAVAPLLDANNGIFDDKTRSHDWVTRVDYQIGDKDSLTARFSLEHWDYTNIGSTIAYAPSDAANTYDRDYTILGAWSHIFTAQVLNQVRVQVVPQNTADQVQFANGTTELSIGNMGVFNQSYTNPYNTLQRRFQFEDSLTWIKGNHTMKFGASYRPVHYLVTNALWFGGEFDFFEGTIPLISLVPAADQAALAGFNVANGYPLTGPPATNLSALESFALGIPVDYRQGFNNPTWQDWANYLGVFAQDSWKVTQNLTLNYGVRMDYDAEPAPVPHNTYFSPRLGIAWQPFGDKKTVIRAGSGIFVAPVNFMIPYLTNLLNDTGKYINQVATALPDPTVLGLWASGLASGQLPFGQLNASNLEAFGLTPGPGGNGRVIFSLAPDYKNAYTVQASASVARELTPSTSLELGYQYYRGVHLPLDQEINYAETGAWDPVWGPQYAPINPSIIQNDAYSSIGNSTYNGGTASFTKRYTNHLQAQLNYTFSKAIDDVTDFNSQFASFFPTRLYLERGISAYNIGQNFVANAVYTTPFKAGAGEGLVSRALADVTLSPIVYLRSGIPFDIRVPGAENGTEGHSLYARPWYVPRDSGIGPDYYDFDLRLTKAFYIDRERGLRLDAIVEGTDLFNHTNFSSVNGQWAVGDPFLLTGPFNVSGNKALPPTNPLGFTSAFPGRQMQFALKFAF